MSRLKEGQSSQGVQVLRPHLGSLHNRSVEARKLKMMSTFQPMSSDAGYGRGAASLTERADGLLGALTIGQAPARARPGSASAAIGCADCRS